MGEGRKGKKIRVRYLNVKAYLDDLLNRGLVDGDLGSL